jgi:hypothetical protein
MKPDKATSDADERIGWDSVDSADLSGSRRYREHYRVGLADPIDAPTGWALKCSTRTSKGRERSLEIVLSAVALHRHSGVRRRLSMSLRAKS